MTALTQMSNVQTATCHSNKKTYILAVASLRLMHIVAIFSCVHSRAVDTVTVERVVDKLYEQLLTIIENTSCNQSTDSFTSVDRMLGDYLVFLRCIASGSVVQKLLASNRWIIALLSIIKVKCEASNYVSQIYGLRPKLLVLQLLQKILINLRAPCVDQELTQYVISELFEQIGEEMWTIPFILPKRNKSNFEQLVLAEQTQDEAGDSVPVCIKRN